MEEIKKKKIQEEEHHENNFHRRNYRMLNIDRNKRTEDQKIQILDTITVCTRISRPLQYVFSMVMNSGIFSEAFKTAIATAKIFERILKERLASYTNKNEILSPKQFGYIEGKSIQDVALPLTDEIIHIV